MAKNQLGEILIQRKILDADQVQRALAAAKRANRKLGDELLLSGLVTEEPLFRALAEQLGLTMGSTEELMEQLDHDLLRRVPRSYLEHSRMIPVRRSGDKLVIVTADPQASPSDLVNALDAADAQLLLITPTNLRRMWSIIDLGPVEAQVAAERADDLLFPDSGFESRMVALFEAMLLDAIGARASDIHLEIYEEHVRLRYRVDGHLHDIRRFEMSRTDLRGVVNVVKIAAEMDITERRLPQGGRLRRRAGDDVYDLRVQSQPALHGEHLIIRLLRQHSRVLTIEDLGFGPEDADRYRRLLQSPQGMVLVVGPTGSGKSTTLYAGLQVLAKDTSRKVITVEDPIEYAIAGVQQAQVNPAIGFAFADAMRSFVREDPDVVLVGEIRDGETALEAIRASQTGHLVLSTLHCNDTVDAVQRLFDLGMHPNSIASELIAVMSQRLVRRICSHCKERVEPDRAILAELFPEHVPEHFVCYAGKGCTQCDGRGTRGRIAAIEFLRVGAEIRRGIAHRMTVDELRGLAHNAGLKPIRNHLIELVLGGITPLAELPETLSLEQMAPP